MNLTNAKWLYSPKTHINTWSHFHKSFKANLSISFPEGMVQSVYLPIKFTKKLSLIGNIFIWMPQNGIHYPKLLNTWGGTEFVMLMKRQRGWFVEWIDNSPAALARREAVQKKERQATDDEEREKRLLLQQIERAKQHQPSETSDSPVSY